MMTFIQNNRTRIITAFVVVLVVAIIFFVWQRRTPVAVVGVLPETTDVLDQVNTVPLKPDVSVRTGTSVSQSPEFLLGFPDRDIFSDTALQLVAYNLGFTPAATVEGIGSLYVWTEGNRTLSIDIQVGTINFSTGFNLEEVSLPSTVPTQEQALSAAQSLLEDSTLPQDYLDFDNPSFEYQFVTSSRRVATVDTGTGPLLKMNIPYIVSGVELVLPVSSYVVVDGNGTIRLASIFIPNLQQTSQSLSVIDWNTAKDKLEKGNAVMIELRDEESALVAVPDSDSLSLQVDFTDSSFGYYVNQEAFYTLGGQRVLTPVYFFEGEQGRAAVVANN